MCVAAIKSALLENLQKHQQRDKFQKKTTPPVNSEKSWVSHQDERKSTTALSLRGLPRVRESHCKQQR